MSPKHAQKLIDCLARGVDPETGEILAPEHCVNSPDVIRALFLASTALGIQGKAAKPSAPSRSSAPGLPQAWKPWSTDEDRRLIAAFDGGRTVAELHITHHRTLGAIESRLMRLGRLQRAAGAP